MNKNLYLGEGNIKSKCTNEIAFLIFNLPSRVTCPYSTPTCRRICFAKKNESFKSVLANRYRNYEETKKPSFVADMIELLDVNLSRKKLSNKKIFVRIHSSGDFYSQDYFDKWVKITNYFKGNNKILFQCYTKSMPFLHDLDKINIHVIYSVFCDSPLAHITLSQQYNLPTFTAVPKTDIAACHTNGAFVCNGDCGNCRECYTGTSKSIVIPYH